MIMNHQVLYTKCISQLRDFRAKYITSFYTSEMQCGNLYIVDGEWEGVSLQQKQPASALEVETAWKPFTDGVCSYGGSREEGHKYKQEERTDMQRFQMDRQTHCDCSEIKEFRCQLHCYVLHFSLLFLFSLWPH